MTLTVPDKQKIGKEQLLLGGVTLQVRDCNGQLVDIHGLMANDLSVKSLQGDVIPLTEYIKNYAGGTPDVSNATITTSKGETIKLRQIADSVDAVQFSIAELQEKYNNL